MNGSGNDWVVGTERFPPSKVTNQASPLTAKLDAMQLLMELNKKSSANDGSSAQTWRTMSDQMGKSSPLATQQLPESFASHSRPTNGNLPHASFSHNGAKLPSSQQQQQQPSHPTAIGINGRKIAVPVKKGKNTPVTTAATPNVSASCHQPPPSMAGSTAQSRVTAVPTVTTKNAKTSNALSNGVTSASSKMSKMSPSSSSECPFALPSITKSSAVSTSPASQSKVPMASFNVGGNGAASAGHRNGTSLSNGNAPVAKQQQNGNVSTGTGAPKEKQQPQSASTAVTNVPVSVTTKSRTTNASSNQTKVVGTQQRSVSVGRGTSAAATKTTATSTTSLPVPPNSPSRHDRNATPVNGAVSNIAANLAANRCAFVAATTIRYQS